MNTNFKKLAAALSAAVIALSLSGCMDNGSLMTIDGTAIRNGVYINYMLSAINAAETKVDEENPAAESESTESESETDFWTSTLEGKDVSEWIKDYTMKSVRGHIGIQRQCAEFGIELTEEEISEINSQCDQTWESSDVYVQYLYGFNTRGEMYEARGISLESYKEVIRVNMLRNKLFLHYYGDEGEYAVPSGEYDTYVNDNYAALRIMEFSYSDYMGTALTAEGDIQAVKDRAKLYAERLNDSERYENVRYDYELAKAKDTARKNAADSYSEDNEEGLSRDEYIEKAAEGATYTVPDSADYYNALLEKSNSDYSDALTDYIFTLARDEEKAYVYEDEKASYVIVRMDMSALETWEELYHENVLQQMRGEAFNDLLDQKSADYTVQQNDYLVNKKYTPQKVDGYVQMK